jgi:hypothetical protein
MRGDTAVRIHHVDLPVVASRVVGGYRGHHIPRRSALFQQSQALGAVKAIDQRLGRDCTNARFDVRYERADRKETRRNGDSELSSGLVTRDDPATPRLR